MDTLETTEHKSTFRFEPGLQYRMPIHFGPQPGPRRFPAGVQPDYTRYPKRHVARVNYLARADQLAQYLPPGFSLWGEPVMTIEVCYQSEVPWLAGRDYALFGISIPAKCTGKKEVVHGEFRLAVWESHADVVVCGREDIGSNKLFAEIPAPRILDEHYYYHAHSMGCRFFEMDVHGLREADPAGARHVIGDGQTPSAGMLWYKYIPRTGAPGVADAEYPVLWPRTDSHVTIDRYFTGNGSMHFKHATWEELPFMYHVVNAIADLELVEFRGASLTLAHGGSDFGGARPIE